jgi:hypothetical protein
LELVMNCDRAHVQNDALPPAKREDVCRVYLARGLGCSGEVTAMTAKTSIPELLGAADAREQLASYARAQRLAAFGVAALAPKLDDASELARATGSSTGKAKDTIATGKILTGSAPLEDALTSPWTRPPRLPKPRSPLPARPPSY